MKKLLYFLSIIFLASCHSSKKAAGGSGAGESVTTPVTTVVPERNLSPTEKLLLTVDSVSYLNYTAKIKVNLNMGNKSVSTSGNLRMRWNDVIQISLVDPFLGVAEVGRLEFSKDNVLVVDRVNKQYMQETYSALSAIAKSELSYEYVQALFWSESQKPNNNNITYKIPLKTPVTLNLQLSNVGHRESWDAHYEVSSKYNKVSAEMLFKALASSSNF